MCLAQHCTQITIQKLPVRKVNATVPCTSLFSLLNLFFRMPFSIVKARNACITAYFIILGYVFRKGCYNDKRDTFIRWQTLTLSSTYITNTFVSLHSKPFKFGSDLKDCFLESLSKVQKTVFAVLELR